MLGILLCLSLAVEFGPALLPKTFNAAVQTSPQTAASVAAQIKVTSTEDAQAIRQSVQSVLRGKTRVPVRWPNIPDKTDAENPLYITVVSLTRNAYKLEIAWTPDCRGGNNCHYGTVRGSVKALLEKDGVRRRVHLSEGIQGYFIDTTCGAHCDDSTVGWTEANFHYSISLKAEKEAGLVTLANSAIQAAANSTE